MRLRPIAALSVAALSALILSGCAGAGSNDASPTGSPADLCAAAVSSGAATEGITVDGDFGAEPTVTFTSPLEVEGLQSETLTEGDGDALAAGDFVQFALTEYNAETGERNGAVGYTEGEALPVQVSADSVLGQLLGCATIGSRIVATLPATEQAAASIDVIDILDTVPAAASGEEQTPVDGFPTVELATDGEPTITVPDDLATPAETQLEVLKKGDGATVASGDTVLVQYTGVLTDGTVFDSSWANGAPTQFPTTGVVTGFKKALEGQTVGSQVVAVIPAAEGYGDAGQGDSIPGGATLIFVVDILAVAHAAAG